MHIIVCIKQVPDTMEVRFDPETNTLIREGVPAIVNPFDENAIEEALRIREARGGKVTVITMGAPQAEDALRSALAMGADEAILLTDRALAGSDTWATSYALSLAVRKIGDFDLILCGKQAIDGDTAQVGPGLAEHLGVPQVTYAIEVHVSDRKVRVKRLLEDRFEVVEAKLPALLTVVKQINEPRTPKLKNVLAARRKEITVWNHEDIGADPDLCGLAGSPTTVVRTFAPSHEHEAEILEGDVDGVVGLLVQRFQELKIV
ncbi:MAG: electron transfer flavoprotein subunit beta/FixA family protein [Armatimonadota bacterium]